ncbi:MAG: hypothetical protein IKG11_00285 [Atopobiaceae bacterium]|nr:hypothetical protein [Atopobiaceae bacterium]
MWYLDYYDYPTYNWEMPANMEDWETHPVPLSATHGKRIVPGTRMGYLMGKMVPFEILPNLEPWWKQSHRLVSVSQSDRFAMGLCSCGRVFIDGYFSSHDYEKKCELVHWKDIVALETGPSTAVGLRKNGRVAVVGWMKRYFTTWRNVTQISVGDACVLGLCSDGTVLAVGSDSIEREVSSWEDIIQISAGDEYALGVRRDGTVTYAAGNSCLRWCSKPADWTDIVQVSAGPHHAAGLKRDGTVIVAETEDYYECQDDVECLTVSEWRGVIQVCAGAGVTAALLENGSVLVARNEKNGWHEHEPGGTSIECYGAVAISLSRHHESDGEVLALDAQGRAYKCHEGHTYPWDNWRD